MFNITTSERNNDVNTTIYSSTYTLSYVFDCEQVRYRKPGAYHAASQVVELRVQSETKLIYKYVQRGYILEMFPVCYPHCHYHANMCVSVSVYMCVFVCVFGFCWIPWMPLYL